MVSVFGRRARGARRAAGPLVLDGGDEVCSLLGAGAVRTPARRAMFDA